MSSFSNWQLLLQAVAFLLLAAPAGYGALVGVQQLRTAVRKRRRLSDPTPSAGARRPAAVGHALKAAKGLGERLAEQDPEKLSALRLRLVQAGYFNREAVTYYLAGKFAALVAAAVAAVLLLPWAVAGGGGIGVVLLTSLFAILALLGPDRVVAMQRSKRETEYREGFPDLLDLLVAAVEAGLSLDAAVNRVADELGRRYPSLGEQLRFLSLELRAGRDRRDAWQGLATRLGLEEARSFSTMLRQAEEMGTSLGETLRVFSEDMRSKRMLRAEEKAMALSAKLIVPLILFIFPCLLGVLLLPAIFRAVQTMSGHG